MTARQVYEGMLVELNKSNAPTMLLQDFNYLFNKTVYQHINKRYNIYDINQQTTDDLRVLKSTAILNVTKATNNVVNSYDVGTMTEANMALGTPYTDSLYGATYEVMLPPDYLHILNCVCLYNVKKTWNCYDKGNYFRVPATRLTSSLWSQIINNFYAAPKPQRPYYYLHNVNTSNSVPTNPTSGDTFNTLKGTDGDLPRTITVGETSVDLVSRPATFRFGNPSQVRMEIRYGSDDTVFELKRVYVDYIKTPQQIRLTQSQLDLTEDTSQIMEFPDYECQEIINELVTLMLENSGDIQRMQSNMAVNQSIASPTQQQTPNKK